MAKPPTTPGNVVRRALAKVVAPVVEPPPAPPPPPELRCENVTWDGLRGGSCRWITTTSTKADTVRFCGAPQSASERLPYCAWHAGLSYDRRAA